MTSYFYNQKFYYYIIRQGKNPQQYAPLSGKVAGILPSVDKKKDAAKYFRLVTFFLSDW